jgi:cytochrome c-type biogenesis protein
VTLWPLAFVAGVVSFSSPCCLPLLPGYLAHVSGLVEPGATALRSRTAAGAALFVAGFALVFTIIGASLGLLSGLLLDRGLLIQLSGVLIIAMAGLQITGLRPAFFGGAVIVGGTPAAGLAGSFPLGMAFAASWTPCVGPVLAAILLAASTEASAAQGAGLLFVYSLGLGVPFMASALAIQRVRRLREWLLEHHRAVEMTGGAVLLLMGILVLSGEWLRLMAPLLRWYAQFNWPPI